MKTFLAILYNKGVEYDKEGRVKVAHLNPPSIVIESDSKEEAEEELYDLLQGRFELLEKPVVSEEVIKLKSLFKEEYQIIGITEIT